MWLFSFIVYGYTVPLTYMQPSYWPIGWTGSQRLKDSTICIGPINNNATTKLWAMANAMAKRQSNFIIG